MKAHFLITLPTLLPGLLGVSERAFTQTVPAIANMAQMQPATFTMGSPTTEASRYSDEVQHTAVISYGFYIAKYEVTQKGYQTIVGSNPSWFASANGYADDLNLPVETVTWAQATNYCYLLTQQALANGSIPSGWAYRLPTETEWEYACRAMTASQYDNPNPPTQPPYPVPWTNPSDGLTYDHYWVGTSDSGYSPSGYVYYVNDWAPTTDPNGNNTTVAANGHRLGTIIGSGRESAWSDSTDVSQGVEFGCSSITSGVASCGISGDGNPGTHWAWCPNQYFSCDLPVYSSLGNGLVYSPSLPAYTTFSFGNAIRGGDANFDDYYEYNSTAGTIAITTPTCPYLKMTTSIGSYTANAFGLCDMHGNVSEWCADWYGSYPTGTAIDPQGSSSGLTRVVRGGSWADAGALCRSAIRSGVNPGTASSHIGLRIALAPTVPQAPWIAVQPGSRCAQSGSAVAFTVTAAGGGPLGCQWQFNGQNVPEARDATLTLNSVTAANSGGYAVIVSNPYGSVVSATAFL